MSDGPAERLVDARGLRCPWPALRLARAMRGQPAGQRYRLLADDPHAAGEIAALAASGGWKLLAEDDIFYLWT